jgi:hypothetical protein
MAPPKLRLQDKSRSFKPNACGYVIIRDSEKWPIEYITTVDGRPFRELFIFTDEPPTCSIRNGEHSIGYNQGLNLQVVNGSCYYHTDDLEREVVVSYRMPVNYRSKTLKVNECGYLVIPITKRFPLEKFVSVEDMEYQVTSLGLADGTPRCTNHSPFKDTKEFKIGFQQGQDFRTNKAIYIYLDTELAKKKLKVYYLP